MYKRSNTYRLWEWWRATSIGRRRVRGRLERWVYVLTHRKTAPFEHILIQTNTTCTRKCPFCYYGMKDIEIPRHEMPTSLFEKIVGELKAMDYAGRVSLFEMNEPLTDPRIVDMVRYVKQQLPRCWQMMVTNGDLLTDEKARALFDAGMDYLIVSAYDPRTYGRMRALKHRLPRTMGDRLAVKALYTSEFVKDNRGGHIPDAGGAGEAAGQPCERIHHILYIKPDGTAVSCFGDYFNENVVGHTDRQTVNEIWFGSAFERLRKALNHGDRSVSPICKECNLGLDGRYANRADLEILMAEQKKWNGVFVGAGASAALFYPSLSRRANMLWLVSRSGRADTSFVRRPTQVTDDPDAVLKDTRVEFVFIGNRSADHFETARRALEAGKHVLSDKPLALTVAEVDELTRMAQEKGLVLGGVFQWRFMPVVQAVKRQIDAGAFGDLLFINAIVFWRRDPDYFVHGRGTRAFDGGGVLLKQAIHALDAMILFGGEPTDVQGLCDNHRPDLDTEDSVAVNLRFPKGLGQLAATTCADKDRPAEIEVIGTKGFVRFDATGRILTTDFTKARKGRETADCTDDAEGERVPGSSFLVQGFQKGVSNPARVGSDDNQEPRTKNQEHVHDAQIANFLEALDEPSHLVVTAAECRRSIRVIEKVYGACF